MFPDDIKRVRYYARDLILPRFLDHAVREYETALAIGNPEEAHAAWAEVMFLAEGNMSLSPRLFHHLLIHYKNALIGGDDANITAAWNLAATAAAQIPGKGLRIRATLRLLRNPSVSKALFGFRRVARPAMRWAFSA
jgi:hypothetical protein